MLHVPSRRQYEWNGEAVTRYFDHSRSKRLPMSAYGQQFDLKKQRPQVAGLCISIPFAFESKTTNSL
jgi:hypothetical protein